MNDCREAVIHHSVFPIFSFVFTLEHILYGGIAPLLVAMVLTVLDVRPWRRGRSPQVAWGAALALGAGFLSGYGLALGWPKLPPRHAHDWLLWGGALFVVLAGVTDGLTGTRPADQPRRRVSGARIAVAALVAAALLLITWLQVSPLLQHAWVEGGMWFILAAWVLGWAWWWQADALARRIDARLLMTIWFFTIATAAQLVMLSGSQRMGQALGGLISAALGTLLILLLFRVRTISPAVVVLMVPVVTGLLVNALAWLPEQPPFWQIAAIVLAPILPWLIVCSPTRRWGGVSRAVAQLVLVLIPLSAVLISAALAFQAQSAAGSAADYYP